jgi:hypothetical protein
MLSLCLTCVLVVGPYIVLIVAALAGLDKAGDNTSSSDIGTRRVPVEGDHITSFAKGW